MEPSSCHLYHPLSVERDLRSLMGDGLLCNGIKYFNYLRVQDDGQYCLLSSNANLMEYIFDNNIPVAAPVSKETVSHKFNYLVMPEGPYDKALHDIKERFNLGHFIDLVERQKNYIELFCFGADADNSQIINFYLNRMDVLEKFKSIFKEKAAALIRTHLEKQLILPKHMMPGYRGVMKSEYILDGAHLTSREVQCLRLLQQGKTAKQTAKKLHLSYRTVESYLDDVKSKLYVTNKSELLAKLTNRVI